MIFMSLSGEGGRDEILDNCIKRLGKGDVSAMSELYDMTKTDLYSFAFSMVGNAYDAEDILHDGYLKIYSAASSYKSQGKPMAWMITVIKSLCLMKLRSGAKRAGMSDEDMERIADESPSLTAEDRIVINQYMDELSGEEREIVSLHAVSGMKHREISELLSMPAATVRSKYTRAIGKLKSIFEKEGF